MSGETKVVPLHEVERLLKQLEKPVRSAKCRAARQLESIPVFPSLIASADQFLHEIVTPVLMHLSSDTEGVRQSCVTTLSNYADELGTENLNETLNYMLPPLFQRLNVEETEPAEEIRLALLGLLLKLIKMITKDTVPNHVETKVMDDITSPLAVAFKNQNPDMKKSACQLLNALMDRCEKEALAGIAPHLITVMIPNCVHRQNEVRKVTIQSLARLYSMSSVTDDLEKVADLTQRLIDDTNAAVRKGTIKFI
jgi:HEAT repeat protein